MTLTLSSVFLVYPGICRLFGNPLFGNQCKERHKCGAGLHDHGCWNQEEDGPWGHSRRRGKAQCQADSRHYCQDFIRWMLLRKEPLCLTPSPREKKIGMWEQDEVACICTVYNVATLPENKKCIIVVILSSYWQQILKIPIIPPFRAVRLLSLIWSPEYKFMTAVWVDVSFSLHSYSKVDTWLRFLFVLTFSVSLPSVIIFQSFTQFVCCDTKVFVLFFVVFFPGFLTNLCTTVSQLLSIFSVV